MVVAVNGQSANEAWLKAASHLALCGSEVTEGRGGAILEALHVTISIANPIQRWVIARNPPINVAFALAEVVWMLSGRNDSRFVNYFNSKLPQFAGEVADYHGAYGFRLRKEFGIDQLARAYEILRSNPSTRQVVLQIWSPSLDLPASNGSPISADIPCNISSIVKIRNQRLEWFQIMRSNDIFRGLPYNIVQFTTLQEVLAGWLGIGLGSYNHLSDSLHVYSIDRTCLDMLDNEKPKDNSDSLALTKDQFDNELSQLVNDCEMIINPEIEGDRLLQICDNSRLRPPFRNILSVLAAEGARRRNSTTTLDIMQKCSNPILRQLWERWESRVKLKNISMKAADSTRPD